MGECPPRHGLKKFFSPYRQMTALQLGMYRISLFQIRPEPDLAGFVNSNPAGAGTGAGFENLVQHKTT